MGDLTSVEEGTQLPKEHRQYRGREGLNQAMVDIENMRQRMIQHLDSHRSSEWKEKAKTRYKKPLKEVNVAGLSFELINSASDETDVLLIRALNDLARDVLYSGNLTNFLEDAEHRTWVRIQRENQGFINGYELAERLSKQ
jgi:hypothetical protein